MTTAALTSYNPATGDVVGEVPVTAVNDIPDIVTKAQAASLIWRAITPDQRAQMLKDASDKLAQQAVDLGKLLSQEMGKPRRAGIGEVKYCADYIPEKVDQILEAIKPVVSEDSNVVSTRYYDPLGVVAAISPWNYPMSMPQWMILPALMTGNSVVLKPSEETPLIAQVYVDTLNECLPADVLQIIHGNEEQGKALVTADVNLVAFTGSRNAGIHIMRSAADGLKRLILELGGKDPLIVLADADIEKAADFAVENSFENAGQACISTERIYVHQSIAEQFENRVTEKTKALKIGKWDEKRVDVGPMINDNQRKLVIEQIDDAVKKGARVLCGGENHPEHFVVPTVLADVSDNMLIMQEETFGPVACISRFSDNDDVIQRANNSVYGLGASVFGKDEEVTFQVARQIDAGMIGINKSCFATNDSPWIGAKHSGYSYHGSTEGHRNYTQIRVVSRLKTT